MNDGGASAERDFPKPLDTAGNRKLDSLSSIHRYLGSLETVLAPNLHRPVYSLGEALFDPGTGLKNT